MLEPGRGAELPVRGEQNNSERNKPVEVMAGVAQEDADRMGVRAARHQRHHFSSMPHTCEAATPLLEVASSSVCCPYAYVPGDDGLGTGGMIGAPRVGGIRPRRAFVGRRRDGGVDRGGESGGSERGKGPGLERLAVARRERPGARGWGGGTTERASPTPTARRGAG